VNPTRPRGRRPGNTDTRREIREAALAMFYRHGYEKVSLRSVAREAGVDPALIHHYFDSKSDLFAEAVLDIDLPDPKEMVARALLGDRATIGQRVVAEVLQIWETPEVKTRLIAMLRASVNGSEMQRPFSQFLAAEYFAKIATQLGHHDAKQRAALAFSLIVGLTTARDLLESPNLASLSQRQLIAAAGAAMQAYLVESW